MAKRKKPLILLVDDNAINCYLLGEMLREDLDCDQAVATNGKEAIEQAVALCPDLILLDIMMPEMDGFSACETLKQNQATSEIPVIFLTAMSGGDDIARGFNAGAVDYVMKPFNREELLIRVKTQLKIKEDRNTIQHQNDEYRQLLHVLCHDLANPFASIMSCLDMIDNAESFCTMKKHLHDAAENGLKQIELVRCLRNLEEKGDNTVGTLLDLMPLVDQSHLLLQARFKAKNIGFNIDISDGVTVKVEPISFVNSVLNNLLSNAIKFSYPNSQIELKARKDPSGNTIIGIRDQGIGMPSMILSNLFDIHKMTSRPGTDGELGTGFGMPLVQRFIEASGGTIKVMSRDQHEFPDDHGTKVFITMPTG